MNSLTRKLVSPILLPLYWLITEVRNSLYDLGLFKGKTLPGKVISVGNLAVGGTGKTPISISLAEYLAKKGNSVALLTRGYKSGLRSGEFAILLNGKSVSTDSETKYFGDEATMQSHRLQDIPIIIGKNRYQNAQHFLNQNEKKIDYWILDDGFQHRQICRDIDLLLIDAQTPLSQEHIMPLGGLREGPKSTQRATHVLHTRHHPDDASDSNDELLKRFSSCSISKHRFKTHVWKKIQDGKNQDQNRQGSLVATGIAHPSYFVKSLEESGYHVSATYFVGDHQKFDHSKLQHLTQKYSPLLITTKDYFRDPTLIQSLKTETLVFDVEVEGLEDLWNTILR